MKLKLKRPLIFLDIESTGVNRDTDRIIELAMCKIFPTDVREVTTFRYNPGIPIPPKVTEIHGITDADVADKPPFKDHAKEIHEYLKDCDLAGYNSNNFDIPMLFNELMRSGIYLDYKKANLIDVGNIFKINEPRTLEAAVKFYCGRVHEEAHNAEADILATVDVFVAQLEKYDNIPLEIDKLALFSNFDNPVLDLSGKFTMKDGVIVLNFGKYRGEPAHKHIDFLEWMCYKADFPRDTVEVAESIMGVGSSEDVVDDLPY